MQNFSAVGMEEDPACRFYGVKELQLIRTCAFWLEGVLMLMVGSVGILGNLMLICVLSRETATR